MRENLADKLEELEARICGLEPNNYPKRIAAALEDIACAIRTSNGHQAGLQRLLHTAKRIKRKLVALDANISATEEGGE